jgi:hypothetical protein
MSRQEDKVKRGAAPYLELGEDVLVAVIARQREWAMREVGGPSGDKIGGRKVGDAIAAGAIAGLTPVSPMVLLVTTRRVIVLKIGLGIGGAVEELVSSLSISTVDEIRVSRLLLGKVITVIVAGEEIKLEVNAAADAGGIAGASGKLKAAAV